MKQFIIIALSLILSVNVQAQNKMKVWLNDNTSQTFDMNNVNRVTFEYSDVPQEGFVDNGDGTGYMDGYAWVDLGDGIKWATCNVGANSPEESGMYFAMGEVITKDSYTASNYTIKRSYLNLTSNNIIDENSNVTPQYDAATVNMGSGWRLPSIGEYKELLEKYSWSFYTLNGSAGYKIVGSNGNSIFLPLAGYYDGNKLEEKGSTGCYWPSTINYRYEHDEYLRMDTWGGVYHYIAHTESYKGFTVRGVVKEQTTGDNEEDIPQEGLYDKGDGTGYLNGHAWVDLGFRTWINGVQKRVVFATMNIGANSPEEPGYYFRWGELNGWKIETNGGAITSANQMPCVKDGSSYANGNAESYNSSTFSYSGWWSIFSNEQAINNGSFQGRTNLYANSLVYGDAATYNWGEGWVTMTESDAKNYLKGSGVLSSSPSTYGVGETLRYYISEPNKGLVFEWNGNSIFMPLTGINGRIDNNGYYWTSTPMYYKAGYPPLLDFWAGTINISAGSIHCFYGVCIRPMAFIDL